MKRGEPMTEYNQNKAPRTLTQWDLTAGTVTFTAASGDQVIFRITEVKSMGLTIRDQGKLYAAIEYQLTSNFYPPHPRALIGPCVEAVKAAINGEWQKDIPMPEGILYGQDKQTSAQAITLIDDFRLTELVDYYALEASE